MGGIFLGYDFQSGCNWSNEGYLAMPLSAFDEVSLLQGAQGIGGQVKRFITVTADVYKVPGSRYWFPLHQRSDYANRTMDGRKEHKTLEQCYLENLGYADIREDTVDVDEALEARPQGPNAKGRGYGGRGGKRDGKRERIGRRRESLPRVVIRGSTL